MLQLDFSKRLDGSDWPVRGLRYATGGRTLAAAFGPEDEASAVGWWELEEKTPLGVALHWPKNCDASVDPAFAPDLRLCAAHNHEDTAGVDYVTLFGPSEEFWGSDQHLGVSENPELAYASLTAMAFTPDGGRLVVAHTGDNDEPPGVFVQRTPGAVVDRAGRTPRDKEFALGEAAAVLAVSPDGKRLAYGTYDRAVRLVTLATGRAGAAITLPGPVRTKRANRVVRGLAFGPGGGWLAARAGGRVSVFDTTTGAVVATMAATGLTDAAFHPDGRHFLTAGVDGAVRLWDTSGWREVRHLDWRLGPVHSVAVAPDGLTAAVGGTGRVVVWDLDA